MTKLKTLAVAAASLVAAASMSTAALAGDYRKCKDTEAAIAGGVVGGSLGTIIGEEIAGRGNKTEGAVLGAIIGGIAGAAVGDSASDCEKDGRIYRRANDGRYYPRAYPTRTYNPGYNTGGYTTVRHPGRGHAYGKYKHKQRDYGYDRGYDRGYDGGYDRRERELRQIDRRIQQLRNERRQLKDRARYEGPRRWIDRRLHEISWQLDRAKADRKRIKNASYRGYNDPYARRGY